MLCCAWGGAQGSVMDSVLLLETQQARAWTGAARQSAVLNEDRSALVRSPWRIKANLHRGYWRTLSLSTSCWPAVPYLHWAH